MSPEELAAAVRDELAAMLGGDAARHVLDVALADWAADPWALGSYAVARPGAPPRARPCASPGRERVHYAGEAAAQDGWHGTVAGAYLSGRAAARAVLSARNCRGSVTM